MPDLRPVLLEGSTRPPRLAELPQPPRQCFLSGPLPRGPAVAIVGTRLPTEAAERFTRTLAAELAREGVAVFSGGARGIDTAAHEGALAVEGLTVVVAPAGLEHPYPQENEPLFQRVLAGGGAYLSLVPPDRAARPPYFFQRNAALVALAHVVVVVEAPLRSGARNAAAAARQLGRTLFVVPSAPWNHRGRGCIEELRLGARPLVAARDILHELTAQRLHAVAVPPAPEQLSLGIELTGGGALGSDRGAR